MTFTWQGRRLATASANGKSLSFKYNSDGIRTQKTVNGVTTYFTLDGSKIISQKKGNQEIFFEYDAQGNVATMIYNGQTYYYVRNLTGEILGLIDSNGDMVVEYFYDPWGDVIDYYNFGDFDLANLNPFKYKDYYYDSELGFYYLNSRYYDPVTSRFINADGYVTTGQGMLATNMFAYCLNNPINLFDPSGSIPFADHFYSEALMEIGAMAGRWLKDNSGKIASWLGNIFGSETKTTTTISEEAIQVLPNPLPITLESGSNSTVTNSKSGDSSKPYSVYSNYSLDRPSASHAGLKLNMGNFAITISSGFENLGVSFSYTQGNKTYSSAVRINICELKAGIEGSTITWDNDITNTSYTNLSVSGWAILAYLGINNMPAGQPVRQPAYSY